MRSWEAIVPAVDREVFEKAGFHHPEPFGKRPALLLIDLVQSFTGTHAEPVLQAIEDYPTSCGQSAWTALPRIRELIASGRTAGAPIVYTKGDPYQCRFCGGATKMDRSDVELIERVYDTPIAAMIAPLEQDFIVLKTRASAFFDTALDLFLKRRQTDSILVCGTSTSGCVRATVVDGISYGYRMFVVEDCCFDRSEFFHLVSLYDMNAKYATVIPYSDAEAYLKSLDASPE